MLMLKSNIETWFAHSFGQNISILGNLGSNHIQIIAG